MKKLIIATLLLAFLALSFCLLSGCVETSEFTLEENPDLPTYDVADFKDQDLLSNLTVEEKKPYTIMIYLNGTDLESDNGCASSDLQEMIDAQCSSDNVNILVLTGGTAEWQNDAVSSEETRIYSLKDGKLYEEANLGDANISDPNTVSFMLNYCLTAYPANKYGFIFWNHGGGPIHGYGSDDLNEGESLGIQQIAKAFAVSKAKNKKMEFIGFDACLMASIEVAQLIRPYCNYFIASEESEPGCGWDYSWMEILNENPQATGAEIGEEIVDTFIAFCEDIEQEGTLSVIETSKIQNLAAATSEFGKAAKTSLAQGNFNKISKARANSKSFGYMGEEGGSFDLVDIYHLADRMKNLFPKQVANLKEAIDQAVVYNQTTSQVINSHGVMTYLPYAEPDLADYSINTYKQLNILAPYESFMEGYAKKLNGKRVVRSSITRAQPEMTKAKGAKGQEVAIKLDAKELDAINTIQFVIWRQLEKDSDYFIQLGTDSNVKINPDGKITTKFDGYWTTIQGEPICLYEVEKGKEQVKYSAPVQLNGKAVNLIVIKDKKSPEGRIVGAIPEKKKNSQLAPKNIIKVKKGDTLTLEYYAELFLVKKEDAVKYKEKAKWVKGKQIKLSALDLKVEPVGNELYLYGFWIKDTQNNSYYTNFIEIRY